MEEKKTYHTVPWKNKFTIVNGESVAIPCEHPSKKDLTQGLGATRNIYCPDCKCHWYNEKFYTRDEWEVYVNDFSDNSMTAQKVKMILIAMTIFEVQKDESGKPKIHHSAILNYGVAYGKDKVKYNTKYGEQIEALSSFSSMKGFWVGTVEDISLTNLMYPWSKKNNCYFLPFEIDDTLEVGEVVSNDFSPLKIMVQKLEDKVKIKLIF